MGQGDSTWVDVAGVRAVAIRFDTSAEAVDGAARSQLGRLAFDGATAGQAHFARGNALHTALCRLTGELTRWARAAAEIATALRAGAERYTEADLHGAARIG